MKTKTITLAGTAMAAVFATALVLPAQAATDTQSNASAKETTRQLNQGQIQHPGVVNGKTVNAQYSQNETGTSSEDMNDQYNQNTGYSPNNNDEDQGYSNEDQQNTGYAPGANDQDNGAMEQNNPQNTGNSGEEEEMNSQQMNENTGAPLSSEELRSGISLTDVPNAQSELQDATIETRNGEEVGTVQSIEVNADGTARAVQADVNGRQVSIDPNDLVYLKDQNALVTDLTRPEIENLPPASQSY